MSLRDRIVRWALRFGRVQCGAFGGSVPLNDRITEWDARWCTKRFGHDDSCTFEAGQQPLWKMRLREKGWDVDESKSR